MQPQDCSLVGGCQITAASLRLLMLGCAPPCLIYRFFVSPLWRDLSCTALYRWLLPYSTPHCTGATCQHCRHRCAGNPHPSLSSNPAAQVMSGKLPHTHLWSCGGLAPSGQRAPAAPHDPLCPLYGLNFVSCDAGAHHGVAATFSGDLFVWGSNDHGQLGTGKDCLTPPFADVVIEPFCEPEDHPAAVAAAPPKPALKKTASRRGALEEEPPPPPRPHPMTFDPPPSAQLTVRRVSLKVPVTYVACGAKHTLAAIAPCGKHPQTSSALDDVHAQACKLADHLPLVHSDS